MKFLKGLTEVSAEDAAVAVRLNAVADRSKLEVSEYSDAKGPHSPLGTRRRFWTPDEVETQGGHE